MILLNRLSWLCYTHHKDFPKPTILISLSHQIYKSRLVGFSGSELVIPHSSCHAMWFLTIMHSLHNELWHYWCLYFITLDNSHLYLHCHLNSAQIRYHHNMSQLTASVVCCWMSFVSTESLTANVGHSCWTSEYHVVPLDTLRHQQATRTCWRLYK